MKITKDQLNRIILEAIEDIDPETGRRRDRQQQFKMYDDLLDMFHKYHFTSEDIQKLISSIQRMKPYDLKNLLHDAKSEADIYHGVDE